ncbi:MAG TPA: hypothetical protein DCS88_05155 [Alphaproteobacteria bacterium]|nr:hypothetical protein [Alphaproteobacteria bacterium]
MWLCFLEIFINKEILMSTTNRRLLGTTTLGIAAMSIAFLAPTAPAEAFYYATTLVPATSYVYQPVSAYYAPVAYAAPVAWPTYSYAYAYPYYTTPMYYTWPNLSVGCIGITCVSSY